MSSFISPGREGLLQSVAFPLSFRFMALLLGPVQVVAGSRVGAIDTDEEEGSEFDLKFDGP